MMEIALQNLREMKWDPDTRGKFLALAQHNKKHINVVEIVHYSRDFEDQSKFLTWNNIEIPIYDKIGSCFRRYAHSAFPEFLKLLFKNYDEKKAGNGKIQDALMKEFQINEIEFYETVVTPYTNMQTDVYHKLFQSYDSISPDSCQK